MLRIALSPTWDMHVGSLRLALLNLILSKQLNQDLIIRIDDIDKEKNIEDKDKEILEIINLFSIDYTQVLYQSENTKYHMQIAKQLSLDSQVSAYDFICAIDDMLCNISTIIRDEDDISNIAQQIDIRKLLNYKQDINYINIIALLNAKDISIKSLIEDGFLPVAIANYIVSLGYDTPSKIFTLEEAMKWFDINKISKIPVKFDIEKLKYINQEHIKLIDNMRLSKLLGYADEDIGALAKLYLTQYSTIKELKVKIDTVFTKQTTLKGFEEEFSKLTKCLKTAPYIDKFHDLETYLIDHTKLKGKQLLMPLKFALIKDIDGPEASEVYPFIKNYLGEII